MYLVFTRRIGPDTGLKEPERAILYLGDLRLTAESAALIVFKRERFLAVARSRLIDISERSHEVRRPGFRHEIPIHD